MSGQLRSTSSTPKQNGGRKSPPEPGSGSSKGRNSSAKAIALRAADHASQELSKRMGKPGMDIDKLAKSLRLTGQQLEGNLAVPYVEKLAGGLEGIAAFIDEADAAEILKSVEKYVRRRPFLAVGGALGLGMLVGRFLKSSAQSAGASTGSTEAPRPSQGAGKSGANRA